MSRIRTAARKDANHNEIAALYEKLGFSVLDISQLKNCADLVVCKWDITDVVEVKDGKKPPSKKQLTDGEKKFHDTWKGFVRIVECEQDVLDHAKEVLRRHNLLFAG